MLTRKIFKIKGPRLTKNAFPEIPAWKKLDKNESARSLALDSGVLKNCLLALWGQLLPLPPPPR